ncbi:hypothetical protein ScPMuIL_001815 [Solemya velum]
MTSWLSDKISNATIGDLSEVTIERSKRTLLDTLGVGVLGSETDISKTVRTCLGATVDQGTAQKSSVWGTCSKVSAPVAAYLNGVSVHSMDFDDTWHPATHPSGAVLPAVLALTEHMDGIYRPSTEDILIAYNVGLETQALLLRCSRQARDIPHRFHPPAVVGVMGSAAASSRLLGLSPEKCRHALAVAASFAGAPMANAGTTTKPLHAGKSARFGLEAALLAERGIEGNENILDIKSGFAAFFDDYNPQEFLKQHGDDPNFVLHNQNIAIKRFPAHLGMHWAIDAAMGVREGLLDIGLKFNKESVKNIEILAPNSRYINRPDPTSEHEARHSFQFNACSALLDGKMELTSYHENMIERASLQDLLAKTKVTCPDDNTASFEDMYVQINLTLKNGLVVEGRCNTPYGHWRQPLSEKDVITKFLANTEILSKQQQNKLIGIVQNLHKNWDSTDFTNCLRARSK